MTAPQDARQFSPRMAVLVTREEERKKLEELLEARRVPICYQCRGRGTATSEMLDIFGLSGSVRLITFGILPKHGVQGLFEEAEERLGLSRKGAGIAFTVPVIGMQHPVFQVLSEETGVPEQRPAEGMEQKREEGKQHMTHVVIWVSVESGYSDEVADAARSAGANGGTVVHGLQRNSARVSDLFGVSSKEERDFVMIVAPKEKKTEIMEKIRETCGLSTKAHGVILALPVDEAFGLETGEQQP